MTASTYWYFAPIVHDENISKWEGREGEGREGVFMTMEGEGREGVFMTKRMEIILYLRLKRKVQSTSCLDMANITKIHFKVQYRGIPQI